MTDEEIAREFATYDTIEVTEWTLENVLAALAAARADEREHFKEARFLLGGLTPNDFRSNDKSERVARAYHILDRALTGDGISLSTPTK